MTRISEEFEQMIARIHELLEGEGAHVEWNEKILDPDNSRRLRQIDVVVRKDGFLNLIECRIHKNKQNVKWIEELIGRRISLNADAVIAVSSNGFTAGATMKAAKHGIFLKDLLSLQGGSSRNALSNKDSSPSTEYSSFLLSYYLTPSV